ncbi:MAG: hypothetical protein D6739_02630 [Nitrospirae bacterium]|nr:MAG: hypothetical protein D6739_02630 [Nitrospirota bacterium]
MKSLLSLTAGLAMAAMLAPTTASALIDNTPHDFSNAAWNFRSGEICRVCHIPHDVENPNLTDGAGNPLPLLWNRAIDTTTTFQPYQIFSTPSSGTMPTVGQPDGISKLCLGCHDGAVALDEFDAQSDGSRRTATWSGTDTFVQDVNPDALIPSMGVGDLRRTHPISMTYPSNLYVHNSPSFAPTSRPLGMSGTIGDVLDNGKVQCSTCHDVHAEEAMPGTALLRQGVTPSTATDGRASSLCRTCHLK